MKNNNPTSTRTPNKTSDGNHLTSLWKALCFTCCTNFSPFWFSALIVCHPRTACPTQQAPHFSTSGYLLFRLDTHHSRCEQQCSTILCHYLSEAYVVFQFVYKIYDFNATFSTNLFSSGFRIIAVFKYLHKA